MSPRKILALVLMVLPLSACMYSWQPTTVGPRQLIEEEEPGEVRLIRTNGDRVIIGNPVVRRDSIASGGNTFFGPVSRERAGGVAISDIRWIEVRRVNTTWTVAAVVVAGAVAIGVVYLVEDIRCFLGFFTEAGGC